MSPCNFSGAALDAPLEGMRIVEFGTFVAIPSAAMTLASLGADVIRIDPLGGAADTTRAPIDADGKSIYWASMNKGKRSITLDLRSEEGRELAAAIATAPGVESGFFLTNAIGDGWFSDTALRARREDLVWIRIVGSADGRPALDYSINWEAGFAAVTGPGDTNSPTIHVLPAWDFLAGMHVALSLLTAERRRLRSGRGDSVQISLADVALWATDALGIFAELQITGKSRERTGDFVYGTFGTPFETADGPPVLVVALTRRQWLDLVAVTGAEAAVSAIEASNSVSMADEHTRWHYRAQLREVFAPWFAARTTRVVLDKLRQTRLVSSALGTFDSVASGPLLRDNDLFGSVAHPKHGSLRAMGYPGNFASQFERPVPLAPVLGQHTESILSEVLGLSTAKIGDLMDRRIASGPNQ